MGYASTAPLLQVASYSILLASGSAAGQSVSRQRSLECSEVSARDEWLLPRTQPIWEFPKIGDPNIMKSTGRILIIRPRKVQVPLIF